MCNFRKKKKTIQNKTKQNKKRYQMEFSEKWIEYTQSDIEMSANREEAIYPILCLFIHVYFHLFVTLTAQ